MRGKWDRDNWRHRFWAEERAGFRKERVKERDQRGEVKSRNEAAPEEEENKKPREVLSAGNQGESRQRKVPELR